MDQIKRRFNLNRDFISESDTRYLLGTINGKSIAVSEKDTLYMLIIDDVFYIATQGEYIKIIRALEQLQNGKIPEPNRMALILRNF